MDQTVIVGITTAAGTVALALVGGFSFRQNRSLIKAANAEAKASADLVTEMQRDRELTWQPVLSVRWPAHVPGTTGHQIEIELTNAGGGPAISCRYVGMPRENSLETMSAAIDVPAGRTVKIFANQQQDRNVSTRLCTWTDEDGVGHNAEAMGAIFAKDVVGTRYRFLVVKDSRSQPLIERVERWRREEGVEPPWGSNRDIWPDYGSPSRFP